MSDNNSQSRSQRRAFLKAAGALSMTGLAGCSGTLSGGGGGGYGVSEIELIEPYGSGGFDVYGRGLAPIWEDQFSDDVTITVRNQPGAGGRRATTDVYNSEPDGSKILFANIPAFVQAQVALDVQYDITEMPPIGTLHYAERTTCVGRHIADDAGLERGDFETLQEYTQENGPITMATFGSGGATHIAALILGQAHNLSYEFAHYNQGSRPAVVQGEADGQVSTADSMREYIEAGDFVPMYVTGSEGIDWLPEVPTEEELGLDSASTAVGFNRMFLTPPGMEEEYPDRLETLRTTFMEAAQTEELQEWAEENKRAIKTRSAEESKEVIDTGQESLGQYEDVLKENLG